MNAPFDLTLLDRELRRHRASSLARWFERTPLLVLDPRVLDKHLDRYRKGRRTLADLCAHYEVELEEAHDAAADAAAALEVTRAVGRRFASRLERLSPSELHTLQAVWHAAQARGLQAWFQRTGTEEVVDPAWPLRPDLIRRRRDLTSSPRKRRERRGPPSRRTTSLSRAWAILGSNQ